MRGMHDRQRAFHEEVVAVSVSGVRQDAVRGVEAELRTVLREIGAAGYEPGYEDAAAGRSSSPPWRRGGPSQSGPGDAVEYLREDVTARAYRRGFDDHGRGRAARTSANGGCGWTTSRK